MARRKKSEKTWDQFMVEFGHNLARARADAGISQERVAQIVGISSNTYQKYEKGESKPGTPANPALWKAIALSQALEVSLEQLLPDDSPDLRRTR